MTHQYSFKYYMEFIDFLNDVEKELMQKNNSLINQVGVSIQLYQEIQDDYTPTRSHTAAINCYCKSIQDNRKEFCNLFDIEAKQYFFKILNLKELKYNNKNPKPLLCFCHADVSNLLFVFNPLEINIYNNKTENVRIIFDNKGVDLYIFIGHFLLNEIPTSNLGYIDFFDKSDGYNFNNIKEFVPIKKINDSYYSLSGKEQEKYKIQSIGNNLDATKENDNEEMTCNDISTATYNDLVTVRDNIQKELLNKLIGKGYIEVKEVLDPKTNKVVEIVYSVSDDLIKLNKIPTIKKISALLENISKQIEEFESVSPEIMKEFYKIRRKIAMGIKTAKANLYSLKINNQNGANNYEELDNVFKNYNLFKYYDWLQKGEKGEVGTKKWIKEGRKI